MASADNVVHYTRYQRLIRVEVGDPIQLWGHSYFFGAPGFNPEERAGEIRAHFARQPKKGERRLVEAQDFKIIGPHLFFMRSKHYADFRDDLTFGGMKLSPMRTPIASGGVIIAEAGDGSKVVSLDAFRRKTAATGSPLAKPPR